MLDQWLTPTAELLPNLWNTPSHSWPTPNNSFSRTQPQMWQMLCSPSHAVPAPWGHCKVTAQQTQAPGCSHHSLTQLHTRLQGSLTSRWFYFKTKLPSLAHLLWPTLPHVPRGVWWRHFNEELMTPRLQYVIVFSLGKSLLTGMSWDVFNSGTFFLPSLPSLLPRDTPTLTPLSPALPVTEHHDNIFSRFTVFTVIFITQHSITHFIWGHLMLLPTQILKKQGNAKQVGAF